jgi:hypothetical protein
LPKDPSPESFQTKHSCLELSVPILYTHKGDKTVFIVCYLKDWFMIAPKRHWSRWCYCYPRVFKMCYRINLFHHF